MTRHLFAGAMTPTGFVDFFDHIMPIQKATRRYYIKGASGSGKSTFIKNMAAKYIADGHYVELFHCSNDWESLDGMGVPGLGLSIMDATAPFISAAPSGISFDLRRILKTLGMSPLSAAYAAMLLTPSDQLIIFPKSVNRKKKAITEINQPVGVPSIAWNVSTKPLLVDSLSVGIATPIPTCKRDG